MRTFAIVNRKGGVGKTTTAVELAFILATSCKQRVLFIDADSQGNATSMMLASGQYPHGAGLAAALEYHLEHYPDIIWRTDYEGLDIIPAGEDLADYELSRLLLGEKPNFDRMRCLMEAIKEDNVYDSVVIDCPPYYSISCLSTIAVSDSIIIPAGIDAYSTTGMAGLVRQIDNIRQACPQIRVARGAGDPVAAVQHWRGRGPDPPGGEPGPHLPHGDPPHGQGGGIQLVPRAGWGAVPIQFGEPGLPDLGGRAAGARGGGQPCLICLECWPPRRGATSRSSPRRSWTPSAGAGRLCLHCIGPGK